MIKRSFAVMVLALTTVAATASAAPARETDPLVDSGIVERVECLFRVYVNEGGENGLDCLA
ncbi:MAG: hypothetical protein M3323_08310 [Actinomycetota bacterium]|nr:hypothetical protein [Actinomycetota bacterium]